MKIELLDAVALKRPYEDHNLPEGCVGTVVEFLDDDHLEVEFSNDIGETYAEIAVRKEDLIVLRYSPVAA